MRNYFNAKNGTDSFVGLRNPIFFFYSKCIYTRFEVKTSIVCVTPPSHNNAFGRFEVVTRMNESNLIPHLKEGIGNGPRGA